MGRYLGPKCRLCRRSGVGLLLKGARCASRRCAVERRAYPPGQHGDSRTRGRRPSNPAYGLQLREKQKLRWVYGISERQLHRLFERATRARGVTGMALLQELERRLDNVVHRLGLTASRTQARQLIGHGHFQVNGRRVNIASYQVRPGDVIAVAPASRNLTPIQQALAASARGRTPAWLELNPEVMEGRVLALPEREQIADVPVQEQLVVEFYSR